MKTLFSRDSWLTLSLAMALLLGLLPLPVEGKGSHPTPLATITVNSNKDEGDADTSDGICDTTGTSSGDPYSGICTLRAAIETANANGSADTINFSGAMTIQPTSQSFGLPSINEQLTINGGGVVVIDGVDKSIFAGLSLGGSGNHQIVGLTIKNFKNGIYVSRNAPNNTIQNNVLVSNSTGVYVSSDGNVIKGNKIGTDGTQDLGNSGDGIKISGANNVVGSSTGLSAGGSCSGDCNLISGNGGDGIDIAQGTDPASGSTNTVRGNFIGTNLAGTAAIPNEGSGIKTNGDNNSFLGNLISGNHGHGIDLTYGADNNVVRGNLIGTQINGTDALGNGGGGVNMDSANGNVIGGDPGTPLPNQCQSPCNLIAANTAGITITQALDGGNMVIGNFIGTDVNGTRDLGNHGNGIWAQGITITLASNLIVHNRGDGVHIYGVGYGNLGNFNHHVIQGNRIGVLADGSDASNYGYGIYVDNSSGNLIGGDQAGQGNTIAHNIKGGVVIANYSAEANRIWGNSIYANNSSWVDKLGIDLNKDGVTLNDTDDSDGGPNNLQNYPVITALQGSQVSGVLTSTANTTFRLEFFANPECAASGYGEGKTFLGTFDVTTNASGRADFQGTLDTAPAGQLVTATATDPDGNTSEFSACFGGLVVNSVGDADDSSWGDGLCNTGDTIANGDPECTLRAAIQEANTMDTAAITFDIPGYGNDVPEIDLWSSALPDINKPVSINGTTQESGLVRLNGFVNGINGLELWNGQSQVRGLALCYFDGHGILLLSGNNNLIVGNLIGVDENNNPCPIGGNGIRIMDTSDNNVIGGTSEAERNVIANSGLSGIYVMAGSSGNTIQGNYIGTDLNGTAAQGNQGSGIHIEGDHNLVGGPVDTWGTCTGACNLIAGNRYGVMLSGSQATNNTVQGNFIGTDPNGTAALGNTEMGVVVTDGASNNLIGGNGETMRNLISGNGSGAGTATAATTIYGGVAVNGSASTGNTVQGNYIGVQSSGEGALTNQGSGVWLYQAPNNTVAGNLISGNKDNGVEVVGSAATGNAVQGNTIGANQDGAVAIANGGAGVFLNGAPGNTIGGTGAGEGNVIAGNTGSGVKIAGDGADNNVVEGNTIGVSGDLTAELPNGGDGVFIGDGASNNLVGGTAPGAGNIIVGNHSDGVELNGAGTTGNSVQGNTIGTLSDGVTRLGNWGSGVYIAAGASGNLVGGVITATANTIAFNGGDGVYVAVGSGNAIRHNTIYTNTGLGIDLGTNGVTPNDAGDADGGANGLQNFPVLTWLEFGGGSASVEGTLNSTANMTYTLEFFANAACDPSLHGEGRRYLGAITVATDGTGNAAFVFTPTASLSTAEKVAATATAPGGNTSEFSRCIRHTEKTAVDPAVGARIVFTDTQGHPTTIDIPAGAITYTQAVTLAYTPIEEEVGAPQGFAFGHHAFELSAYLGHTPLAGLHFSPPITITIHYSDEDVVGMNEEELMLRYWDGSTWSEDGITVVERNTNTNYVVFTVAHLSDFALFGQATGKIYLPLILRNR